MTNVHVLPQEKEWAVKKEGAKRASKKFSRKDQATRYAQSLAKKESASAYIHDTDGAISEVKGSGQKRVPASKSRMETQRRIHVMKKGDDWAVQTEGADRPIKRLDTKYEAIRLAHSVADRRKAAMVVHDNKNRISHIDIPPHYRSPLSAMLHLR